MCCRHLFPELIEDAGCKAQQRDVFAFSECALNLEFRLDAPILADVKPDTQPTPCHTAGVAFGVVHSFILGEDSNIAHHAQSNEAGDRKNPKPRIESSEYIVTTGSVRPLIDAFRIAHVELVLGLTQEHRFDKWEAFQLVSQLGTARIGKVVDPNYCVLAKFPRKYLAR